MSKNSLPNRAIVIDGDITRKIATVYVPDFYKENPIFQTSLDVLKNSAYELEYVFGMIQKIPELVDVDKCPDHLLPLLGSLLGYKWNPEKSVYFQRRELAKLVQVYHIKGSPKSIIRLVYYAGASISDVFTQSDYLFQFNKSKLSGGDHFEDPEFWRWGTYEVVADIDFSKLNSGINSIHPAGTVWYGRQLIQNLSENSGKDNGDGYGGWTEVEIIHTGTSNYLRRNAELYDDVVLYGCGYSLYDQEYLIFSYKADAIDGLVNNASLGSWLDFPFESHEASQETAGNKPTFKSAENGRNNLPVVSFDGGDYLHIESFNTDELLNAIYGKKHAVFLVLKLDTTTGEITFVGRNENVLSSISYSDGSLFYFADNGTESPDAAEFTWAGDTNWHVISFVRYNNQISAYVDGVELAEVASSLDEGVLKINSIGGVNGSGSFDGLLGEFAVIDGEGMGQDQLYEEWSKANDFLRLKWGWAVEFQPSTAPMIYYRFDEPVDLEISKAGFTAKYGSAIYGEAHYGASELVGRIAYNNKSSSYHGHYNQESKVLFYTNSIDNTYDPLTPLETPPAHINPGTVLVEVGDEIKLSDNGRGLLIGDDGQSTARVDYDTGTLSDFRFPSPPGVWPSPNIPLLKLLESDIPTTNQELWLKADAGLSYDVDYAKVLSWTDQSPNEYVFETDITDRQPTIENADTETPSIYFNGTSALPAPSSISLSNEHTLFLVFKPSSDPTGNSILLSGDSEESRINVGVDSETGFSCISYHSDNNPYAVNYDVNVGKWHILTVVRDAGDPKFYIDGVEVQEKWDIDYTASGSFSLDNIGALNQSGDAGFVGYLNEIMVYSSALTDTERKSIEIYLANKYIMPSGQVLWYDAKDLYSDVHFWKDKSNQGNTAVQGTGGSTPQMRPLDTSIGRVMLPLFSGNLNESANKIFTKYVWLRAGDFLTDTSGRLTQVGSTKEFRYNLTSQGVSAGAVEEFEKIGDGESGTVDISDLILRKNGDIYGTPHSSITDIQTTGNGLYRHIGSVLSFSLPTGEDFDDSQYSVERPMPPLGTKHTITIVFALQRKNKVGSIYKKHALLSSFSSDNSWIYYDPDEGHEKIVYQVSDTDSWEVDVSGLESNAGLLLRKLYCLTIVRQDEKAEFYLNGERIGSSLPEIDVNTPVTFSRFGVEPYDHDDGSDPRLNPLNGYLAELVVYDRVLSIDELEELNHYLQTKWGILQLPVTVYYNDYVTRAVSSILPSTVPERTGVRLGSRQRVNKGCIRLDLQGDNEAVQPSDKSYGFEAWIKTTKPGSIFSMEWNQGSPSHICRLRVNVSIGGRIRFIAEWGGNEKIVRTSPVVISDNEWHHVFVGMYRDEDLVRIYVDGVLTLIADTYFGDFEFLPDTELLIGAALAPTIGAELRNFFFGGIDEVAIYKSNLPDEDCILRHYLHGNDNLAVIKSTIKYIVSNTDTAGNVSQSSFIVGKSKIGSDDVLGEARLSAMCTDNSSDFSVTVVSP